MKLWAGYKDRRTREPNATLRLAVMRAEADGMIGEGVLELKPGEPNYEEMFNMLEVQHLRERCALLESLLAESLRHGYLKENASPSWLFEAHRATDRTK